MQRVDTRGGWMASVILMIDWDAHQKKIFCQLVNSGSCANKQFCQCTVQAEKGREGEL